MHLLLSLPTTLYITTVFHAQQMDTEISKHAVEACDYIKAQMPAELQSPTIAIICGSGLGGLSNAVEPHSKYEIDYKKIPHFPGGTGK